MMYLFKDRLARWRQYLKYLRYVFNDHAVLALFILAGAGGLAYQSLWQMHLSIWTKHTAYCYFSDFHFQKPTNLIKQADPTALLGTKQLYVHY